MRFASIWTGIFLGSATLASCSASDISHNETAPDEPADDHHVDATLTFEGPGALEISPGAKQPVTVIVDPPLDLELSFALIGAPSDASLDASRVQPDASGRATVALHAPSTPATFTLRVSIDDGPSAALSVAVNKAGVGVVEVVPAYSGHRPVTEWVGVVVAGTTCKALKDQLPGEPKGSFVAASPAPQNPVVQSIPVGPKLAVHVRAGHFAWGCTDAHDIAAGTTTKVKVHVVDVPPALQNTDLDVALTYAPSPTDYAKMMAAARTAFLGAMFPPTASEATSLLDAMIEASADPDTLALAREEGGWDALAEGHFYQLPKPLTHRMTSWIDLGMVSSAPEIRGRLTAVEGVPGKALFDVATIAGFDAKAAGTALTHLMSWTSAPDDAVFLGGTVYWLPTRLVGAACRAGADLELGALETMTDTLAKAAACSDLASSLGGVETCDAACLLDLCRAALTKKWQAALDVSANQGAVGTIQIGASGTLKVDDRASPVAASGTWLGTVSDGATSASAGGDIAGILWQEEPAPEDPPEDDPPE